MAMTDAIKQVFKAAMDNSAPMQIMFGVVTQEQPLAILVENRLTISGEMIVAPKEYKKGYYDTHKHRLAAVTGGEDPKTGEVKPPEGSAATTVENHIHVLKDEYWTNNEDNSAKEREFYYGLKAGEQVILLRDAGGQRFLVVGRL